MTELRSVSGLSEYVKDYHTKEIGYKKVRKKYVYLLNNKTKTHENVIKTHGIHHH